MRAVRIFAWSTVCVEGRYYLARSHIDADRQDHGGNTLPLEAPLNRKGRLIVQHLMEQVFMLKDHFSHKNFVLRHS